MARSRKNHVQLPLARARKPPKTHGGWRPNAGRKKKPGAISHDVRPFAGARYPLHVTLRLVGGVPSLAREWLVRIIRGAIADSQKRGFRICEFNVLANHLHLIVEANGKSERATGMQGFKARCARRLNRALKRTGALFAGRYHSRALKTPRQVRNGIRYVLLNRKHHAKDTKFSKYWIDPYSSAAWFDGWSEPIRRDTEWKTQLVRASPPTARATVWLLTTGWRRHGALRFDETPG